MSQRLAVIDGKSVFYRGYYAMPSLSTSKGVPTGGVYGFAALSLELIKKLSPDYVAVAWDKPKTNIRKRRQIYPQYKAGRKPAPPDFYEQIPLLHELLKAFHWPLFELDDYEADDIMGALAKQAVEKHGLEVCLITSDLDALQLLGPKTHLYALKQGFTNIEFFDPAQFERKYGLSVHQFLDFKALKGDASDNIPGVPGVGEKTAALLLNQYSSLEELYRHLSEIKPALRAKLEAGRQSADLSKQVARLWLDAPVTLDLKEADVKGLDARKLSGLLKELEFNSLLSKLPTYMRVSPSLADKAARSLRPAASGLAVTAPATAAVKHFGLLHVDQPGARLWLTWDGKTAAVFNLKKTAELKDARRWLQNPDGWAAYDIKTAAHQLDAFGLSLPGPVVHDCRQAAFLLDPLRRERSLEALLPEDFGMDNPAACLGGLWRVTQEQRRQLDKLPGVKRVAQQIDFPLSLVLFSMEREGIGLDVELLKQMSKEVSGLIAGVEVQIYDHVGYQFNLASPSQLADALYGKLALSILGVKKGKSGNYSTGQRELTKLRGAHPVIGLIEKHRELTKLLNTYIATLPEQVGRDGRLHTTFNQDVAATGRLSSANPNLQNIPIRTPLGQRIRQAFVPASGNVLVGADYSQFELRLAAVLAGDKQLIKDFDNGLDIHAKTASDVLGVPLDQVTKDQRRVAKIINFGVLYGMSPHGLSEASGMSFGEARRFIDDYFRLRAPIKRYIDQTLERAKRRGYVETLLGRRRPTPDLLSSNFVVREAAARAAANMPIQGTEADLMKMAMLAASQKIASAKWRGDQPPRLLLQIHDSLLAECSSRDAESLGRLLKETMEKAYPDLGIRLRVDVTVGQNWGEL